MKDEFLVMRKKPLSQYFKEVVEPEIDVRNLSNSRKNNGLSTREKLGLVLLSYFLSLLNKKVYVPAVNKNCDDGAIADLESNLYYPVEQTYVYEGKWDNNALEGIEDVFEKKIKMGDQYAVNSWLLIYCNAKGSFNSQKITKQLNKTKFRSVIIVGPNGKEKYSYYIYLVRDGGIVVDKLFELKIDNKGCGVLNMLWV